MRNKSPSISLASPLLDSQSTFQKQSAKLKQSNRPVIPRIANREIPLHQFYGATFKSGKRQSGLPLWHSLERPKHYQDHSLQRTFRYDRPVQLLKQYLNRKERLFISSLQRKSDEVQAHSQRSVKDYRIKKDIRGPSPKVNNEPSLMGYNAVNESKEEFNQFSLNKSLYEMTNQELAESIQIKHQFLETITKRMRQNRNNIYQGTISN